MTVYFIDTSIFMYAAGKNHPLKKPCVKILESLAHGKIEGISDCEVIQEILYRYSRIGKRDSGIKLSQEVMKSMPSLLPIEKEDVWLAGNLLESYPSIEARDAIPMGIMLNRNLHLIISADKHFDQIQEIKRIDPQSFK